MTDYKLPEVTIDGLDENQVKKFNEWKKIILKTVDEYSKNRNDEKNLEILKKFGITEIPEGKKVEEIFAELINKFGNMKNFESKEILKKIFSDKKGNPEFFDDVLKLVGEEHEGFEKRLENLFSKSPFYLNDFVGKEFSTNPQDKKEEQKQNIKTSYTSDEIANLATEGKG